MTNLITAGVEFHVPHGRDGQNVPLDRHVKFAEIDAHVDDGRARPFFQVAQIHLKSVVGPAAKLEDARLFVKGKIFDVNLATRLVDGRRFPFNQSRVVHCRFGGQGHFKIAIRTVKIPQK